MKEVYELSAAYKRNLQALLRHCIQKQDPEQTPSDFSADKLTFDELEHITRLAKNL